jgi:cold shock CspA family protein
VIELTNHRRRQGRLYHVKIVLNVPNEEIVIGRNHDLNHAYEDVYVALRDAFDAAKRQLQDHVGRTSRNKRVVHIKPPHAHVKRLMYEEGGYGFLETKEGRELYFNRNAVLHRAFDRLKIGSEVRFDEELGEEGPQATTVELVA